MHGVVNGIVTELLRTLRNLKLGCAGALFGRGTHLDVLLGGIRHDLSEELGELRGVLGLLERVALARLRDLRIALALCLAGHCEVHADFAALAVEVVLETLCDFRVLDLAVADHVLAGPGHIADLEFLALELGTRNAALGALLGSRFSFIHIPAHRADPSFHFTVSFLKRSHFLELVLADAALRTGPVIRKILEGDSIIVRGIVDISTNIAHVFLHFCRYLSWVWSRVYSRILQNYSKFSAAAPHKIWAKDQSVNCKPRCTIVTPDARMYHLALQTDCRKSASSLDFPRSAATGADFDPEMAVFGQSSAMRTQATVFDLQLQLDTLPRGPCHGFAIDTSSRTLRPVSRRHVSSGT